MTGRMIPKTVSFAFLASKTFSCASIYNQPCLSGLSRSSPRIGPQEVAAVEFYLLDW